MATVSWLCWRSDSICLAHWAFTVAVSAWTVSSINVFIILGSGIEEEEEVVDVNVGKVLSRRVGAGGRFKRNVCGRSNIVGVVEVVACRR